MINTPRDNQFNWNQPNTSDLFGNVFVTKNITFDGQGYLKLSYSPRNVIDETVDASFDNPAVIIFNDDYGYFVGTWDACFQVNTNILFTTPTLITTSGVPSGDTQSDAVWFGGLMPFSQDTDVDYYNPAANTWTDTDITLTNSGQHQMVNFVSLSALAIADVNTVKLYDTPLTATPTLITTLTISADFKITGMCYFNQNIYIATQNVYGGHAFMYIWNGLGTAAQQAFEVDSNMIFSICQHKDSVYLLTGNGSLLRFNGGGFDIASAFPVFYTDQSLSDTSNIGMYKNIMKSNGNLLYILFTNQNNTQNLLLDQPDGLWCYDENIGLYHRYSPSISLVTNELIDTADVNTTTNEITVTSAPVTGTEVYYNDGGGTSIPELTDDTKYYVIKINSTTIKLAYTLAEALSSTAIDLTGTGSIFQKLVFFPNTDFGQFFTERTFSVNVIERPVNNRQYGTDLLYGVGLTNRELSSTLETLGTVSFGTEARGYYITPKITSNNVTDNYDLVTLKFSPFTSELDKIIIKYRTIDDMKRYIRLGISGNPWVATWTSSTTFTTTETQFADAIVGNEIEFLKGAGSGILAHITAISENAGTYTVTIDESYDNYVSGDKSVFIFRNWIKWKTIEYGDSNANQYFLSEHIGVSGKFLQLKIELRGIQTRIEELLVDNVFRLPAKDK